MKTTTCLAGAKVQNVSFLEAGNCNSLFPTNLCNFDELATTILLHVHVEPLGLNFQRLAKKLRVAWQEGKKQSRKH